MENEVLEQNQIVFNRLRTENRINKVLFASSNGKQFHAAREINISCVEVRDLNRGW